MSAAREGDDAPKSRDAAVLHGPAEAMTAAERAELQGGIDDLDMRAQGVKRALSDPAIVAQALGLEGQHASGGFMARCLWHEERTPSMSLRAYSDGIGVRCFGCGCGGTVLDLIGRRAGYDARRDFPVVVRIGEELARELGVNALRGGERTPSQPERTLPPTREVADFGRACGVPFGGDSVGLWCASRGLDVLQIVARGLGLSLPRGTRLPRWARSKGGTWAETGHHLIVPTFDPDGLQVSVHARVTRPLSDDMPKSLWPCGYVAAGIMANSAALDMLRRGHDRAARKGERRVFVCEGVPDFLTYATHRPDTDVVLGLTSAVRFGAFASRLPVGARVYIHPHDDSAGQKYARDVIEALREQALAGTVSVHVVNGGGVHAVAA